VATATLGDHLVAQGLETNEIFSRGARVRKHETEAATKDVVGSTEFLAVNVFTPAEPLPVRTSLCRVTCRGGQVLEFNEWPDAGWLAALLSGVSGTGS
jgi:hypothetical protein